MKYYNRDDIDLSEDYTTIIGHRGTGKAFARVKYYLNKIGKKENSNLDNIVLCIMLESYCDCLLDLDYISNETYDKILSVIKKYRGVDYDD